MDCLLLISYLASVQAFPANLKMRFEFETNKT